MDVLRRRGWLIAVAVLVAGLVALVQVRASDDDDGERSEREAFCERLARMTVTLTEEVSEGTLDVRELESYETCIAGS